MSPIVPCVWLDAEAEAAATFYLGIFPNSHVRGRSHYPASVDNPGHKPRGSTLTVEVELAGQRFCLLNGGPVFSPNPSVSFFVHVPEVEDARRVYDALAEGGSALMPFGVWPWSPGYGWIQDRFGVSWQVMAGPRPAGTAMIVPCLMFAGDVHLRAEEALQAYTALFPGSRIEHIERYPQGGVVHARAVVGGQELIAMDSHVQHAFGFNEGLSLQVLCADQAEVDRLWAALGDGGRPSVCGWVTDRFGLSWQVVPTDNARWLTSDDAAARDRAFAAMMTQRKPDIAATERAFQGEPTQK